MAHHALVLHPALLCQVEEILSGYDRMTGTERIELKALVLHLDQAHAHTDLLMEAICASWSRNADRQAAIRWLVTHFENSG